MAQIELMVYNFQHLLRQSYLVKHCMIDLGYKLLQNNVQLNFFLSTSVLCQTSREGESYEKLIKDLLDQSRHDKKVRPVENPSQPINVSIALALHYIENLVNTFYSLDLLF